MDLNSKSHARVNRIHKNRTQKRIRDSHIQKKYGISRDGLINRFKRTIERRNDRINKLVDIIRKKEGVENELKIVARRELKKKDTKYKKLQERYEAFKQKNGQRNVTKVYKTKYKTYEPSNRIKWFEKIVKDAKQLHQDYLGLLEHQLKTVKFITEECKEYKLDNDCLLILLTLKILGKPSQISEIVLDMKLATKRRILGRLEEQLMVRRPTYKYYELTVLGQDILNNYKNFLSYGKTEVLEMIKESSGLVKQNKNKEDTNYDEI